MATKARQDDRLAKRLGTLALSEPDYWSFRGNAKRDHGHGLMQYPAMMVPQMVRALLDEILAVESPILRVGDPFVGSGTVLTEAMLRGLDFVGRDINPLAILLCRVKSGPIFPEAMQERSQEINARIAEDRGQRIEATFHGIDKWFSADVQRSLSRIRRAIQNESCDWARRFFWVALADTVRLCCNSRTSTFKLHIRSMRDRATRQINPKETFSRILKRNLERFESLAVTLREKNALVRGRYTRDIALSLADSRTSIHNAPNSDDHCDLIITSPPYGDNTTTVPYGQYSYLPLQWVDLDDIHPDANANFLSTTHEIDRRSLGGSRRIDPRVRDALCKSSPTLDKALKRLRNEPSDRPRRVVAFMRDLEECVPRILSLLRSGGVMVWVLGNRRVGGGSVPLDGILTDLLAERGSSVIANIKRRIPSKRMAVRNSVTKTMANETILVLRKA